VVIDQKVDEKLIEICLEIAKRYQIEFIEIGTDKDHVHFLIQSVPTYSPTKVIQTVKSLTAREIFKRAPEVKRKLWGGEFWSDGYYVSTVGRYGSEDTIRKYVKEQGKEAEYQQLHEQQLKLFE
jgi:REP element-mobilizing transposase RayT